MEHINLTALAKLNKATTPATRAKLDKLGVKPVQEVQMPSGRKFVLFDKVKAVKAIEKSRSERDNVRTSKAAEAHRAYAAAAEVKAKATGFEDRDALMQELADVKKSLQMLLDHATRPQGKAGGSERPSGN